MDDFFLLVMNIPLYDHSMCFGAFDVLHAGHRHFIGESMRHGRALTVVVARDASILRLKGHVPLYSEEVRCATVQEAFPTVQVILGDTEDFYAPLRAVRPDVVCLGYDQRYDAEVFERLFPEIAVVRIDAYQPDIFKSSLLKASLGMDIAPSI